MHEHSADEFTSGAIFPAACSAPATAPTRQLPVAPRGGGAALLHQSHRSGAKMAISGTQESDNDSKMTANGPSHGSAPARSNFNASSVHPSATSAATGNTSSKPLTSLAPRPLIASNDTSASARTAQPPAPITYDPLNNTHLPPARPGLSASVLPHFLASVLRPHQLHGVRFLYAATLGAHGGAILADDMGLGKSIQAIAACYALMTMAKYVGVMLHAFVPQTLTPQASGSFGTSHLLRQHIF